MQTVFYILASVAAVAVLIAVPVVAIRALVLMARLEDTRKDLAALIEEGALSLHHANRFLAHAQDGLDRLRHAMERMEKVLAMLQPAAAVGGILSGARRVISGGRRPAEAPEQSEREGESS